MEVTITFLMITYCFRRKLRRGGHISKIAWKPVKFNLNLYANKNFSVKPLSLLCSVCYLRAKTFFSL